MQRLAGTKVPSHQMGAAAIGQSLGDAPAPQPIIRTLQPAVQRGGSYWAVRFSTFAATAIEDVIADLSSLLQRRSPARLHPVGVIMGGAAGGIAQRRFAGEDLRRELLGFIPGGRLARTLQVAIGGERELAAAMAGALIDHRADGMTIMARIH